MSKIGQIIDKEQLVNSIQKWRTLSIFLFTLIILIVYNNSYKDSKTKENIKYKKPIIARININGIIKKDKFRDKIIIDLAKNKNIKALIVTMDSGGGEVVATEYLYNAIKSVSQVIPVVTVMESIATSGAYMASLAGDYILAMPGTITGSIGVKLETYEIHDLAKKIGINFETYALGEHKAFPSYTNSTPKESYNVIMKSLENYHQVMIDLLANRRNISIDNAKSLATGEIFIGIKALEKSLIDAIGDEKTALSWLQESKNIDTSSLEVVDISIVNNKNSKPNNISSYISDFIVSIFNKTKNNILKENSVFTL